MMRLVATAMALVLAGCSAAERVAQVSPAKACVSETTRDGLLQAIKDGSRMFGISPLEETTEPDEWEVVVSQAVLERYDRDTGRVDCSADAWIARIGAPQGVFAGRVNYAIKTVVGGGNVYELTGDEAQLLKIGLAVNSASEKARRD